MLPLLQRTTFRLGCVAATAHYKAFVIPNSTVLYCTQVSEYYHTLLCSWAKYRESQLECRKSDVFASINEPRKAEEGTVTGAGYRRSTGITSQSAPVLLT